jgi:hypothetical protein
MTLAPAVRLDAPALDARDLFQELQRNPRFALP